MAYVRPHATMLVRRLAESRRFIQAVAGPRQVGKTTLVQQVVEKSGLRPRFASADEPTLRGHGWINICSTAATRVPRHWCASTSAGHATSSMR